MQIDGSCSLFEKSVHSSAMMLKNPPLRMLSPMSIKILRAISSSSSSWMSCDVYLLVFLLNHVSTFLPVLRRCKSCIKLLSLLLLLPRKDKPCRAKILHSVECASTSLC